MDKKKNCVLCFSFAPPLIQHTVSARIITIIKGIMRGHRCQAQLPLRYMVPFPKVSRKQTRKPGLLLLVISLKLALFSVTTECLPHGTSAQRCTEKEWVTRNTHTHAQTEKNKKQFSGDDRFSIFTRFFYLFIYAEPHNSIKIDCKQMDKIVNDFFSGLRIGISTGALIY